MKKIIVIQVSGDYPGFFPFTARALSVPENDFTIETENSGLPIAYAKLDSTDEGYEVLAEVTVDKCTPELVAQGKALIPIENDGCNRNDPDQDEYYAVTYLYKVLIDAFGAKAFWAPWC